MSAPSDATWRRTNLGHLLFAATGRCVRIELDHLRRAGFDVSEAQLALFRNLEPAGTWLTVLADRAGLKKQSMIELVDKAERRGLVHRSPDPNDGRAKIVRFRPDGLVLLRALQAGSAAAERDFAAAVGASNLSKIKRALSHYAGGPPANIERALADAGRQFVHNVLSDVHRHGYREVTEALLALFRTLELGGSRLTDVAAAARITKQSMRALVERAETLALVEREPDPVDGRAKTIRFSGAGLVMLEQMRCGVAETEARFAAMTGEAFLADLKAGLGLFISGPPAA